MSGNTAADALVAVATHLIGAADLEGLERLHESAITILQQVQDRIKEKNNDIQLQVPSAEEKVVRILLPGCFDMMHAGHYNALRQAKAVCQGAGVRVVLVAGIHNDAAIAEQKGPTVFKDPERVALVTECKWVDEVAMDLPYLITPQLLDSLNCDFVAHGDDLPTRSDGTSVYGSVIQAGRFKLIKRTEGVSTTTLIGRLLSMSNDHLRRRAEPEDVAQSLASHSSMLPTLSRLAQFKTETLSRDAAKRVVYVDGAFDLFHVGHMEFLKKAKALGDYLLVGVHSDTIVHTVKGRNYPIQDMCERALCVLAMASVDDVIVGAPWVITNELIKSLGISVVATGVISKNTYAEHHDALPDPYAHVQELGILEQVSSGCTTTTETVIERIVASQEAYTKRNQTRAVMEDNYKANKEYVAER